MTGPGPTPPGYGTQPGYGTPPGQGNQPGYGVPGGPVVAPGQAAQPGYGAPPQYEAPPRHEAPPQYDGRSQYEPHGSQFEPHGALPHDPHPDVETLSVGDLMGRVSRDLSTLMRQELALAQAELKQEARNAGRAAAGFGGAGFGAYMVLLFLSVALWAGLTNVMDGGWAGLVVAAVWAVIAAVGYVIGRSNLRRTNPTPERTVDTLKQVPDALKSR
ncbi:hypothetical protein PSU4_48050 [Pseudonocardia sulfidoxydans NBRC 16205]|uniref:Uncharacterized protein n=1 Tax=Pseudonocardia sulfidoxydans NBRC 16205 TaxID=1223511 RepID=A0A511DM14_9PSEU|nr:phage holin family protein [Pseudonocardia sulfidoxydans]GEL25851.1 hypothetical protein PSU4_48050 [Pseudonocardia sulfidoxydans NBRC 16205]